MTTITKRNFGSYWHNFTQWLTELPSDCQDNYVITTFGADLTNTPVFYGSEDLVDIAKDYWKDHYGVTLTELEEKALCYFTNDIDAYCCFNPTCDRLISTVNDEFSNTWSPPESNRSVFYCATCVNHHFTHEYLQDMINHPYIDYLSTEQTLKENGFRPTEQHIHVQLFKDWDSMEELREELLVHHSAVILKQQSFGRYAITVRAYVR